MDGCYTNLFRSFPSFPFLYFVCFLHQNIKQESFSKLLFFLFSELNMLEPNLKSR